MTSSYDDLPDDVFDDIYQRKPNNKHRRSRKAQPPNGKAKVQTARPKVQSSEIPIYLPAEVLERVFMMLDQSTLRKTVNLVCRQWKHVSDRYISRVGAWKAFGMDYQDDLLEKIRLGLVNALDFWFQMDPDLPRVQSRLTLPEHHALMWQEFVKKATAPLELESKNKHSAPSSSRNTGKTVPSSCLLHLIRMARFTGYDIGHPVNGILPLIPNLGNLFSLSIHDYDPRRYSLPLPKIMRHCPLLKQLSIQGSLNNPVVIELPSRKTRSLTTATEPVESSHSSLKAQKTQRTAKLFPLLELTLRNVSIPVKLLEQVLRVCPLLQMFIAEEMPDGAVEEEANGGGTNGKSLYLDKLCALAAALCPRLRRINISLAILPRDRERCVQENARIESLIQRTFSNVREIVFHQSQEAFRSVFSQLTYLEIRSSSSSSTWGHPSRITRETLDGMLQSMPRLLHLHAHQATYNVADLRCSSYLINYVRTDPTPIVGITVVHISAGSGRLKKKAIRHIGYEPQETLITMTEPVLPSWKPPVNNWACTKLRSLSLRVCGQERDMDLFYHKVVSSIVHLTDLSLSQPQLLMGQSLGLSKDRSMIEDDNGGLTCPGTERGTKNKGKRAANLLLALLPLRALETITLTVDTIPGIIVVQDFEFMRRTPPHHWTPIRIVQKWEDVEEVYEVERPPGGSILAATWILPRPISCFTPPRRIVQETADGSDRIATAEVINIDSLNTSRESGRRSDTDALNVNEENGHDPKDFEDSKESVGIVIDERCHARQLNVVAIKYLNDCRKVRAKNGSGQRRACRHSNWSSSEDDDDTSSDSDWELDQNRDQSESAQSHRQCQHQNNTEVGEPWPHLGDLQFPRGIKFGIKAKREIRALKASQGHPNIIPFLGFTGLSFRNPLQGERISRQTPKEDASRLGSDSHVPVEKMTQLNSNSPLRSGPPLGLGLGSELVAGQSSSFFPLISDSPALLGLQGPSLQTSEYDFHLGEAGLSSYSEDQSCYDTDSSENEDCDSSNNTDGTMLSRTSKGWKRVFDRQPQLGGLIMPYAPLSVHDLISIGWTRTRPLLVENCMRQILEALKWIHEEAQLMHRDISSGNILVTVGHGYGMDAKEHFPLGDIGRNNEGRQNFGQIQCMISDFGCAVPIREPRGNGKVSQTGHGGAEEKGLTFEVGTRAYRAPELLFSSTDYTTSIDMWSAGVIFAEMFLGRQLFVAESDIGQICTIVKTLGAPTEENWPEFSSMPDYGKLLFKSLEKTPLAEILLLPAPAASTFPLAPSAGPTFDESTQQPPTLVSQTAFELIEQMIVYSGRARISAQDALQYKDGYLCREHDDRETWAQQCWLDSDVVLEQKRLHRERIEREEEEYEEGEAAGSHWSVDDRGTYFGHSDIDGELVGTHRPLGFYSDEVAAEGEGEDGRPYFLNDNPKSPSPTSPLPTEQDLRTVKRRRDSFD
ncbi:Cyclin-dependent kinase 20 [Podila epigama]|nr:Cyclin-dependent kinase 20 [Podila epigama]